jgi:hypothetical protein
MNTRIIRLSIYLTQKAAQHMSLRSSVIIMVCQLGKWRSVPGWGGGAF